MVKEQIVVEVGDNELEFIRGDTVQYSYNGKIGKSFVGFYLEEKPAPRVIYDAAGYSVLLRTGEVLKIIKPSLTRMVLTEKTK